MYLIITYFVLVNALANYHAFCLSETGAVEISFSKEAGHH